MRLVMKGFAVGQKVEVMNEDNRVILKGYVLGGRLTQSGRWIKISPNEPSSLVPSVAQAMGGQWFPEQVVFPSD